MKMSLAHLPAGRSATIASTAKACELIRRRLIDFGVMEGAVITVVKRLPFGGPLTIHYKGQLIGLRLHDAGLIEVEAAC